MIHLLTQYYKTEKRKDEFKFVIKKNQENERIEKLHIFLESEFPINKTSKTEIIKNGKRMSFMDYFEYINEKIPKGDIVIIANNDIFYDETIKKVGEIGEKECYTLTRYNIQEQSADMSFFWCQDSWIFRTPIKIENKEKFEIYAGGKWHCEHKLSYELFVEGYKLKNPSFDIISYHFQPSEYRTCELCNCYEGPYLTTYPQKIEKSKKYESEIYILEIGKKREFEEYYKEKEIKYMFEEISEYINIKSEITHIIISSITNEKKEPVYIKLYKRLAQLSRPFYIYKKGIEIEGTIYEKYHIESAIKFATKIIKNVEEIKLKEKEEEEEKEKCMLVVYLSTKEREPFLKIFGDGELINIVSSYDREGSLCIGDYGYCVKKCIEECKKEKTKWLIILNMDENCENIIDFMKNNIEKLNDDIGIVTPDKNVKILEPKSLYVENLGLFNDIRYSSSTSLIYNISLLSDYNIERIKYKSTGEMWKYLQALSDINSKHWIYLT